MTILAGFGALVAAAANRPTGGGLTLDFFAILLIGAGALVLALGLVRWLLGRRRRQDRRRG